jgi:16S rRNA (uracil1498-N3)-methyltransferase
MKWQQVAIEAAKQCGQNWLPRVHRPRKLKDFFLDVDVAVVVPTTESSDRRSPRRAPHRDFDLRLIGSLQSDAQHLKKILADYANEPESRNESPLPASPPGRGTKGEGKQVSLEKGRVRPTSVLMMIGPEGDFTPAELALAKSHGCRPITLGPIILRVETAAIYCLSVLSYELL